MRGEGHGAGARRGAAALARRQFLRGITPISGGPLIGVEATRFGDEVMLRIERIVADEERPTTAPAHAILKTTASVRRRDIASPRSP